jgi:hypothetical protein
MYTHFLNRGAGIVFVIALGTVGSIPSNISGPVPTSQAQLTTTLSIYPNCVWCWGYADWEHPDTISHPGLTTYPAYAGWGGECDPEDGEDCTQCLGEDCDGAIIWDGIPIAEEVINELILPLCSTRTPCWEHGFAAENLDRALAAIDQNRPADLAALLSRSDGQFNLNIERRAFQVVGCEQRIVVHVPISVAMMVAVEAIMSPDGRTGKPHFAPALRTNNTVQ